LSVLLACMLLRKTFFMRLAPHPALKRVCMLLVTYTCLEFFSLVDVTEMRDSLSLLELFGD
jgi:hypothetical protein